MRAGKDSVSRRRQGKGLTDGADAAAWRRGSGQRAWRDKARRGQRARWVQSAAVCPPLARATSLGRRVRTTGLDPAGEPPAPPCSDTPSPHRGSGTLRGRQGKGDHGQGTGGSRTCSLGHDHLGFAAGTVAFHGVGGYSDGVGGLRLQVCDDHLLQGGGGGVSERLGLRPALPTLLPGLGTSKVDVGPGPQAETCTELMRRPPQEARAC